VVPAVVTSEAGVHLGASRSLVQSGPHDYRRPSHRSQGRSSGRDPRVRPRRNTHPARASPPKGGRVLDPVLGLIFLEFADSRFTEAETVLAGRSSGRRTIGKADYQSRGVLYIPGKLDSRTCFSLPVEELAPAQR
jgi:hypothetical protein